MPRISDIFGSEKLSYEEFVKKAAEAGGEFGDVAEMRKAHTAEMNRLRVTGAVEREAMRAGAKNSGLLMRVIDMGGITVDESGVHGIAEQIGKLRESDPYLFAEKEAAVFVMESIELLFLAYFEGQEDTVQAARAYGVFEFIKENENRISRLMPR
jgi:hypothetical protein